MIGRVGLVLFFIALVAVMLDTSPPGKSNYSEMWQAVFGLTFTVSLVLLVIAAVL